METSPPTATSEAPGAELRALPPAPVRILDLRLVITRDGQTRVSVDGRELLTADSPADSLRYLSDRLTRHNRPEVQLEALRSAIVPSADYQPIPMLTDEELEARASALEGTSSAVGQLYIATLRAEQQRRAEGASVHPIGGRDFNPDNGPEAA